MKVGDLVKNGQGNIGIIIGLGYTGKCPSEDKSPFPNPDVHVYVSGGRAIWSHNAVKVISKAD